MTISGGSRPVLTGATVLISLTVALGLTGCAGSISAAEKAAECTALAKDLVSQGLAGVPTEEQAREIGNRLDTRLNELKDPSVHDAAVALHQRVHSIETAAKKGDTERVTKLADQARQDVAKAAKACGMPESAFTG